MTRGERSPPGLPDPQQRGQRADVGQLLQVADQGHQALGVGWRQEALAGQAQLGFDLWPAERVARVALRRLAAIDAELQTGARVGPFTVVAVPGKSPGEVALHCPRRRLLIVGDALIGNPPGKLSLLRERVMDDPPRLRASVAALVPLDLETILVGDGVSVLRDAGARLRELVATFPA